MAKPPPGKCIHCLRDPVERDWDHVFPASWYPDSTEASLYKWRIPSCIPCNRELGTIEQDFLVRVGLTLDPDDDASRSIVQKALRSMRPSAGKSERDRNARAALGRRILADTLEGDAIPAAATIPGLGERWGRERQHQTAVLVPADSFRRMTKKIVRGIFFVEDARFIEPPYEIDFYVLHEAVGRQFRHTIDRHGATYAREPGVVVRRAVAHEDGLSSVFEIEFWKQFKTYATVTRP